MNKLIAAIENKKYKKDDLTYKQEWSNKACDDAIEVLKMFTDYEQIQNVLNIILNEKKKMYNHKDFDSYIRRMLSIKSMIQSEKNLEV